MDIKHKGSEGSLVAPVTHAENIDIEDESLAREPPMLLDFPDGGKEAWLVAAGTATILFCTLGYTNSFGVFQAYYMFHQLQEETPDAVSWIGSTQAFLVFASGAVGGPIFDRYGAGVSSSRRHDNAKGNL